MRSVPDGGRSVCLCTSALPTSRGGVLSMFVGNIGYDSYDALAMVVSVRGNVGA